MRKTLSLLLTVLLFLSFVTACGNGNAPKETTAQTGVSETKSPAGTEAPDNGTDETTVTETEAPAIALNNITENGIAKSHIILSAAAHEWEKLGAEELRYHIQLVSGAEITVSDTKVEGSLPIFIGTPDSMPELETLFPEDLAWLRDVDGDENYKRYGTDGFAVRKTNNAVYIFGETPRGALNGAYDFIEENLGIIWTRSIEEIGTVYEEMPTVEIIKADYREKSPFDLRGRVLWGNVAGNTEMLVLMSRNKQNTELIELFDTAQIELQSSVGFTPLIYGHNVKHWLTTSPIYDASVDEYWETNEDGEHGNYNSSNQVNFWSELTADTVAASMISALDSYKDVYNLKYVGVCEQDFGFSTGVYPEQTLPFEYAPGQFVYPEDDDYFSTVYFAFINRIARQIKEKYPDVVVPTYAYGIGATPPRCELEDNIAIVFTFYSEDVSQPIDEPIGDGPEKDYNNYLGWLEKTSNVIPLNYYNCNAAMFAYERPIWDRMQGDFQMYAEHGLIGMEDSGVGDSDGTFWWEFADGRIFRGSNPDYSNRDCWAMTALSQWLYHKLAWNPTEDVDALIKEFCDKCYGNASEEMQEYYRLLEVTWTVGSEYILTQFNSNVRWNREPDFYFVNFADFDDPEDGEYLPDKIMASLEAAYEAAEKDVEKQRIGEIKRLFGEFSESGS